ncbi:ADP-ribosylglycohydrolase family protein [Syntrophus aciditrophicus]|uniref:ADP-ribosylglycohydrolase n=1 Tax=Syntrophus aciditrophicus (strain SB) TaxID=56780 RepID=Q2LW57_SYNAS|nr:ADP-ribosylglycohydrolase family protein [Syntrophus aciditrophicus]ABC78316.1 ADP-ribosylglycohydrolase [Syntrophus aciditrophicus SB]
MFGAIAGDVIGSVYELTRIKTMNFQLFQKHSRYTDDTVMTLAIAHAILHEKNYAGSMKSFGRRYPNAGYGPAFFEWIFAPESRPYHSWGNGSAMRVSPIGYAFSTRETVLSEARKSAEVSHNHPEGIKGAQAVALAVFLARTGAGKKDIRKEIHDRFEYNLNRTIDDIRPDYRFDVSCQGSVPEGILAFLDSEDYEDAIRKAVSLGGDSDTLACIAGGIAQAFYKEIPAEIVKEVRKRLPQEFLEIIDTFNKKYTE